MNKNKQGRFVQARGIIITIIVFVLMVLVVLFALTQVDERTDLEQTKSLEDAVLRATLTCYAVEGRYPADVQYLQDHYGIVYNEDKYIVDLDSFAQNILPDITVLVKGGVGE